MIEISAAQLETKNIVEMTKVISYMQECFYILAENLISPSMASKRFSDRSKLLSISIFLLSHFLFEAPMASAQKVGDLVKVESSDQIKSSSGSIIEIIGQEKSDLLVLKRKRRRYSITRYNESLAEARIEELDLRFQDNKHDLEYIFLYAGKLWLFTTFVDKDLDEVQLFQSFIDPPTLKRTGDENLIASVKRSGKLFKNEGHFDLRYSSEKERMAIVTHYPYEKDESEKVRVNVFSSEDGEVLWQKEIELPYKEDLFAIESTRIDDDGNFYILGKRYGDGLTGKAKEKKEGEKNYDYMVLGYFNKGSDEREYLLTLEDKFISDLQLAVNKKGEIICAGFYADTDKSGVSGSYFMRLDPSTKAVITQNLKEFNIDFITQNFSERAKKKAEKRDAKGKNVGLFQYDLDEMVLRDDGGVMLIGEQYYVKVVTSTSTGANGATTTRTTYHYYYNDIIVVNISPEGAIEWTDKIAKRQHTTNDNGVFSSYLLGAKGDKIYLIFNDNPKNLSLGMNSQKVKYATFARQKNSIVSLVSLDIEGRSNRLSLLSLKDEGMLTRPYVSEQINKNTLILLAQKKKAEKIYRITLKD